MLLSLDHLSEEAGLSQHILLVAGVVSASVVCVCICLSMRFSLQVEASLSG